MSDALSAMTTTLGPLYLIVLTGFFYRHVGGEIDPDALTDLIMNVVMPCLIFNALLESNFTLSRLSKLAGANVILVIVLFGVAALIRRWMNGVPASFELPVLFMNAGFLGIPLLQFYGGDEAMASIVIFDQVQSLFIFTLGIWLMTARLPLTRQLRLFLEEPIVWSILAGLILSYLPFGVPPALEAPARAIHVTIATIGEATIPLALFLLGFVLHRFRPTLDRFVNLTILIRLAGSTLLGGVICVLLDLRGPDGAAVLIGAGLPAAVFSYVLAQRYDKDPGFAAGAVFYTSLVSALSLPALLFFARMWYPPPFP